MYGFGFGGIGSLGGKLRPPATVIGTWDKTALDAPNMLFSNSDKTVVSNNFSTPSAWACYSLAKKSAGKWFASITIDAREYGDVSITDDADHNYVHYAYNGDIYSSTGVTLATIAAYAAPCVIDMAFDATAHLVWFRVNGGNWNSSGAADPATGTGGYALPATGTSYHAKVQIPYFSDSQRTLNTGSAAFTYAAPSGFAPLGT